MKALVTGATGLIGSHLAEQLLVEGHRVRALVRPESDTGWLRTLGVERVVGDLTDPESLERAVRGVDVVHHNAARVSDWGPFREFAAPALDGTAALLRAARRAGVSRFVHMSSASVHGLRRVRGRRVSESTRLGRPPRSDPYSRAKILSERIVLGHAGGPDVTVLRPTFVYGPRDRAVLPRVARLLREGRLIVAGRGDNPLHLIHAADVARAAVAAGARGAPSGVYLLDGLRAITQREFLSAVAAGVDAPPPSRRLPLEVLWALAIAEETAARIQRAPEGPGRTRYLVAFCGGEAIFDTSRAERELGFKPRVGIREGLASALAWWREADAARA